jgi:GntR family transcriptional regulator/MocR family aminotransferase
VSRHGSGIFVREISLSEKINKSVSNKTVHKIKIESPGIKFHLRAGGTDMKHFPFGEFSRLTSRFYRSTLNLNMLQQSDGGYINLQIAIASYLRLKRGVQCKPHQIVITNGSQEGIFLTAKFFLRNNNRVYIENPAYNGAKKIFLSLKAKLHFIDTDKNGMRVENIPNRRDGLVYVTPSHQFPLGVTMSIARRLELLDKAQHQNLVIIEDDYDSDFRYNGEPIASLQSYDTNGRVIYLGTFSKVLYPGIRLGYIVLPEQYVEDFKKARRVINQDPSIVQQAVVAEFIKSGKFYRYLKKMHRVYLNRKNLMEDFIKKFPGNVLIPDECN